MQLKDSGHVKKDIRSSVIVRVKLVPYILYKKVIYLKQQNDYKARVFCTKDVFLVL
jgi:hypothetical protein